MPITESRKRANDTYIRKQDNITTRYKPGSRERIQAAADTQGDSMNQFIIDSVMARVERIEKKRAKNPNT
jgi:uncharacterized protein (DUF1778 family)